MNYAPVSVFRGKDELSVFLDLFVANLASINSPRAIENANADFLDPRMDV